MKFGPVPLHDAVGAILAHAVALPERRLSKGTPLGPDDIALLRESGLHDVVVAKLGADDVGEDEAATLISAAIRQDHLSLTPASTGRLNIHATVDGMFVASRQRVDLFNRVDAAITLACLADHVSVRAGDMVATIKIIPLAVDRGKAADAAAILAAEPAFAVKPFVACDVSLIATMLPSLKPQVMDKTRRVLETRLQRSGSTLVAEVRVAHTVPAVAQALRDAMAGAAGGKGMAIVFGASAVTDTDDVIPSAIRAAGGQVEHIGMPVDPGNLLVLGRIGDVTVIGAPGCARSPRENGFDWVLDRILAGEPVGFREITGMGVGGLLAEIATRPKPRALTGVGAGARGTENRSPLLVRPIVLAAGQASRMGPAGQHKLLAEIGGMPLVRRVALAALATGPAMIVTGHRAGEIRAALDGLDLAFVHNDDYASGMASSLKAGLDAARDATGAEADGILVLLADMPGVSGDDLKRLVSTFREQDGQVVVRAVSNGKRGNPVLLPRALFPALRQLEGDVGARHVIETGGVPVVDVEIGAAAHFDLDTPEAILAAGGILKG